jgi:hypothetical protein
MAETTTGRSGPLGAESCPNRQYLYVTKSARWSMTMRVFDPASTPADTRPHGGGRAIAIDTIGRGSTADRPEHHLGGRHPTRDPGGSR